LPRNDVVPTGNTEADQAEERHTNVLCNISEGLLDDFSLSVHYSGLIKVQSTSYRAEISGIKNDIAARANIIFDGEDTYINYPISGKKWDELEAEKAIFFVDVMDAVKALEDVDSLPSLGSTFNLNVPPEIPCEVVEELHPAEFVIPKKGMEQIYTTKLMKYYDDGFISDYGVNFTYYDEPQIYSEILDLGVVKGGYNSDYGSGTSSEYIGTLIRLTTELYDGWILPFENIRFRIYPKPCSEQAKEWYGMDACPSPDVTINVKAEDLYLIGKNYIYFDDLKSRWDVEPSNMKVYLNQMSLYVGW
jgi:hypothetical protein